MTKLELIDRLCAVSEMQSRIVREPFVFIDEQMAVEEAAKGKFAKGAVI